MIKRITYYLVLTLGFIVFNENLSAQAPTINYSPNNYTVGVNSTLPSTIIPAVTNTTGGNVPLVNYTAVNTITGVTFDATTSKLFAIDNADKTLYSITIPGAVATVINSTVLYNPQSIVADKLGNIYVSDLGNGTPHVYKFNTSGALVTTFSGFTTPYGLSADASNNIYVADYTGGKVFKITSAGVSAALPLTAAKVTGAVAVGTTLYLTYANAGNFASIANGTTTGTAKTILTTGYFPNSLTLDASNNIYDADASTIYKITTGGVVTTPYSTGVSAPYQVTFDASGNLYEADNGTNFINISSFQKFTISPAPPAGIVFNTATGQISGTAPSATSSVTYTVTAYNSTSNASATVTINIIKPPALNYPANNVFTLNAAVSLTPANTGGAATSCTISPALPTGLSISATGVISGTPTVLSPSTAYTVSATNGAGTTTSNTFNITVVSPPVFSYTGPNVYTKGTAIAPLSPTITGGGPITSAISSPALPAGLSIGTDGTISGTPTAAVAAATYTITATNSAGGVGTATVSITVVNPPVFSYSGPNTYTTNKTITALSPTIASGGPISSVTVSPLLPAGLTISTAGVISGTPTIATATATYTITATNSAGGVGTATVTITVADPPVFSYTGPNTYTTGTAITALSPTTTSGGPITSASSSPALPAGLSVNSAGVISGTPTAVTATTTYTITAANSAGGTGTATVTITVTAPAPALTYTASNTFTVGTAVTLTPSNSGGAPTSATINPALPAGLSLSAAGVISGTPTAVSASTSYTVAATNTGGTVNSNAFTITVNPQLPAFTYTNPVTLNAGTAYTLTPANTGGAATFTVSPGLPSGLSLDGSTGIISGTPAAYTAAANYVVTGTNATGSSQATINITVYNNPAFSYSPNSYTFTAGTALPSTITPTNTGGAVNATGFGTGTALSAPGNGPQGLAFDASGNLYVANYGGRVKKYTNATGAAVNYGPSFTRPAGLVFDASGNLYVLDNSTGTITKLNSAGTAVTFAGPAFTNPSAIAIDANGNLYVSDFTNNTITGITAAGTIFLTISTNLSNPTGVAIDAAGNIYALNEGSDKVTKYDKNGNYISAPVTGLGDPYGLTIDADGNIYIGDKGNTQVAVFNQSGTALTTITGLTNPEGMATDAQGNLYVSDNTNNTVTKYPPAGGYYLGGTLPPGLLFNSNTGQFTGTPASGFASTTLTVTGVNASGKSSTAITFSCPTTSPSISYSPSNNIYIVGTTITTLTPSNTGGAASGYSINTALPAGLTFNPNTGVISGTPTTVTATTTYTITATNSASSNSASITLTVNPKPPVITYPTPVSYAVNVALSIIPTNTSGGTTAYSISPALPAGITISTSTGVISGTATSAAAAANYTVTATNVTGTGTFVINVTIVAPPVISYTPSTNAYPVNVAITPLAPANSGGPVYPSVYNAGTTFATGLTSVWGITTDASGNIYVVYPNSSGAGSCVKYSQTGTVLQNFTTTGLSNPVGVAVAKDGTGTIYVTGKSGKIYRYTSTGGTATYLVSGISTYSSGGSNGLGMVIDAANNLYSADDLDGIIWKYNSSSATLTQLISKPATGITNPSGLTLDPGGNVDFVDYSTKSLLRYNSAGGYLSTLATGYTSSYGVFADASGNIFAGGTTSAGTVTEYSQSGAVIGNITTTLSNPRGITESPTGILYITDYTTGQINRYLPNYYVLSGGTLPGGLSFDPATGIISGTPTTVTAATTYTITAYGFGHIPVTTTVIISCYNSFDWVGTQTGGYWNIAANWKSGVVPTSSNDVNIGVNNSFTYPPVINASTSVKSVTMGNMGGLASSVYVANNIALTVVNDITKQSDVNSTAAYSTSALLGPGTINAVNVNVLANTVTASGTYTDGINSSVISLLLSGNIALTSVNSTYATNAAFTVSGGTVSLTGTGTSAGIIATSNVTGSTSALNVTGGTLQWINTAPLSGLSSVAGSNIFISSGTGVIDYHGAAQTIYTDAAISGLSSGVSYQGLKLSGTGAKTLNSGNLNIAGNFTNALTNDASNYITLTGTPVIFNGTTQSLAGGAGTGTVFKIVSFSGAGTKTMASGLFSVISAGTLNMLGSSSSTVLNAGGLLTLISDVNGSASVTAINGPSITGNVNVQRYITGGTANYRGYRLLSSPVSTSLTSGIVNINYLINSVYLTGTSGTGGGFDGGHSPSLYLFRDNLVPSNATFTSGNFRGINNITSAPSYVIDIDGSGFNIPTGNGYMLFFRGDRSAASYAAETTTTYVPTSATLTAVGTLNQGQVTVKDWFSPSSANLDYSTISGSINVQGFNLAGNPYASSIDWDKSDSTSASAGIYAPKVTGFIYVLDSKSKNYNVYQRGTGGAGTLAGSGSNIIPSGQGFFVVAYSTAAQLVFSEQAKTNSQATAANGNLFLALQQKPEDRYMHLELIKDSVNRDGIILSLSKEANANYSRNEDAAYKTGSGQVSLASRSADGIALAINATPYPTKAQPIPLTVGATTDGSYTFNMEELKHIPDVYDIWLKDAYMKDSLDIRHNPAYSFSILHSDTNSYGANRFSLIIRKDPSKNVHLLNFVADKITNAVKTVWTVENEEDYTDFTLQKSNDGLNFKTIDTLTSSSLGTYSFTDINPQKVNYYRLQLTDVAGIITYSAIVPVMYGSTAKTGSMISVYPNPTNGMLNVAVNQGIIATSGLNQVTVGNTGKSASGQTYDIRITNMTGEVLKTVTSAPATWQNDVSGLLPGTYIIQVLNHGSSSVVGRSTFVKL